jgi:hypothetical protein
VAVEDDLFLRRNAGFFDATEPAAFENPDLRLDDIQARHLFGDCMLHLNARIDLDEIEGACLSVHQEFDRASADVVGRLADR